MDREKAELDEMREEVVSPLADQIERGNEAVLLRIEEKNQAFAGIKLAKDGHTVLIPQPSDDPQDPLNWSWRKKHIHLFIVAWSAFCGDFASGAGIPCIFLQGAEWQLSPAHVNYATNLGVLMYGLGGLFWIPVSSFWGRGPVLFYTYLAGTLFTLGCALSPNFETFYAMRALQGFTLTTCQMIGLSYIKDMFFFHEHARKIGLWASLFLVSPYLGPMFSNFIIAGTGDWRLCFWVTFAFCCLDMVLIVLFADESFYRRDLTVHPDRGHRLTRLLGIWRFQVPSDYFMSIKASYRRLVVVFFKPVIIPICIYYGLSFMWAIGINITSSILLETPKELGGYGFNARGIGYIYFTPVVATILGETFGHYFNDFLANHYVKKHGGIFKPEVRLLTCFVGALFMLPGLIVVGQSLQHLFHYVAIIFGWGMYVFGVLVASVAITAYALDCYPNASAEMGGYINFARTISGFTVGYFQQPWGQAVGWGLSFGIQSIIVGVATALLLAIYLFGERMRRRGGPLVDKGFGHNM